jgi:hypothetical protein
MNWLATSSRTGGNMIRAIWFVLPFLVASPAQASSATWLCTYNNFAAPAKPVTVALAVEGSKLVHRPQGVPSYDIVEDNEYGLIATEHLAKRDEGVRIFSSTILINKSDGEFIYMIGEIGMEPRHRTGYCVVK